MSNAPFHVNILTLFPDMFPGTLGQSLAGKALDNQKWSYNAINIRDHAEGVHKTVDDTPYGGGAGMVMRADIIEKALLSIPKAGRKIYMSPRGTPLSQDLVKHLAQEDILTILCGRYEGVDQRVLDAHNIEEISIGDYVLSGGEPAATIMLDACIRLLPGVMGNTNTVNEESFSEHPQGKLLEYPHYTRPDTWIDVNGTQREVPDILKSGHHKNINEWRAQKSLEITRAKRPDLLVKKDK